MEYGKDHDARHCLGQSQQCGGNQSLMEFQTPNKNLRTKNKKQKKHLHTLKNKLLNPAKKNQQ